MNPSTPTAVKKQTLLPSQEIRLLREVGRIPCSPNPTEQPAHWVWEASDQKTRQVLTVDFTWDLELSPLDAPNLGRHVLDLSPWQHEGWPLRAILTYEKAVLPDDPKHPTLVLQHFQRLGHSGQVWSATGTDPSHSLLPLEVEFVQPPLWPGHEQTEQLLPRALRELSSPYVTFVRVLDLRGCGDQGWAGLALVTPWLAKSLQEVLANQEKVPFSWLERWAWQIQQGLDAIHQRGMVHRNLQPSNVKFRIPDGANSDNIESLRNADAVIVGLEWLEPDGAQSQIPLAQSAWHAPEVVGCPTAPANRAEDHFALGRLIEAMLPLGTGETQIELDAQAALHSAASRLTNPVPESRSPGVKSCAGPPDYRLLNVLGAGGMGVVYLAERISLKREEALKVLKAPLVNAASITKFKAEAEALARFSHPHIVQVYGVSEHEGTTYLAMEYCPGPTLSQQLEGRFFAPEKAVQLLIQLADAVATAHAGSIVHRDLKPGNILLVGADSPKITDFGLAQDLDKSQSTPAGTPAYMAPEQIIPGALVGQSADIWALGIILYESLSGQRPFRGMDRDTPPTPVRQRKPAVSRDLDAITMKCLNKDPAQRYGSASELAADLRRYQGNFPVLARPVGPLTRLGYFVRRWPLSSLLGVGALIALAGFLITGWIAKNEAVARAEEEQSRKTAEAATEKAQREKVEADAAKQQAEADKEKAQLQVGLERVRGELELSRERERESARKLAMRADWRSALPVYEKLIADGQSDQLPLRVERLPGLIVNAGTRRTFAELDELFAQKERLSKPDLARLLLLRGDYSFGAPDRDKDALDLVRQALDLETLSKADQEHARGLLSANTARACEHFREAIRLERGHPRAHHALVITLVLQGNATEARKQADLIRTLFTDDPLPGVADSLLLMFEGKDKEGLAALDGVKDKLGPERHAAQRKVMALFGPAVQQLNAEGPLQAAPFVQLLKGFAQRIQPNKQNAFGFNVPVATWMEKRVASGLKCFMLHLAVEAKTLTPSLAVQQMRAECQDAPDALQLIFLARALDSDAHRLVREKKRQEGITRFCEALDTMYRAADAQTLMPQLPFRYEALFTAVEWGSILAEVREQDNEPQHAKVERDRIKTKVDRLLREGRQHPKLREALMLVAAPNLSHELAMLLYLDWELDHPDKPDPLLARGRYLLQVKRPFDAFELADNLRTRFPKDRRVVTLFNDVRKQLPAPLPEKKD